MATNHLLIATRTDRLWRETEEQRQAEEVLGGWTFKRLRECMSLSKTRLNRLPGFLVTGNCLLMKHSRNLTLVEDASCRFDRQGEETSLNLLSRCDAVMTKTPENLRQH